VKIEFADEELRRLYVGPEFVLPQFGQDLIRAYRKKIGFLASANSELDLRAYKALRYEKLRGDREGQHSVRLNQQWRLILRVETDEDERLLIIVEIVDYH
jgi:toxin HigB-1